MLLRKNRSGNPGRKSETRVRDSWSDCGHLSVSEKVLVMLAVRSKRDTVIIKVKEVAIFD